MPTQVIMPALGMAQETGLVVQWKRQPGDAVEKGEPLLEVETDKAVVEVEAPASGTLAQITAEEGAQVPVGEQIALILAPGEEAPGAPDAPAAAGAPSPAEMAPAERADGAGPAGEPEESAARVPSATGRLQPASPKARRIAVESGLDLGAVKGSGPGGAVLASDLEAAAATARLESDLEVSRTWRIMAERTAQAWSAPHFYLMREVLAGRLIAWRHDLASRGEQATVTDLLVKLAALTLRKHPHVAAAWREGRLVRLKRISVGIAVASDDGLVVPVMPGADERSVGEIAAWREKAVERARSHRLTPADLEGGVFTISNLGTHGVDAFTAILNGGQAAILAVGRIAERPVVREGRVEAAATMVLTLGCDHRAVDGARGALFLRDLAEAIEDPGLLS